MQNPPGSVKQIPLMTYLHLSITDEVKTEMQDLLITQGR